MSQHIATCSAEYAERTRDENKQRELHPSDIGSLSLDAFRTQSAADCRAAWLTASDADKRGLALQIIRHKGHGPDEATIALYLGLLEERFGLGPVEIVVASALERLAEAHQRSAESAETKEERVYFRRWSGAFRKALYRWLQGVRPEQTPGGAWLVTSATRLETVHQVERSGECTCEAQNRGCWHSALVSGIESAYDDMERFDGGDDEPRGPIVVTIDHDGLSLGRGDQAIVCRVPADVAQAIGTLVSRPADLGRRIALAREACYLVAA
jgi:hypothetical protein